MWQQEASPFSGAAAFSLAVTVIFQNRMLRLQFSFGLVCLLTFRFAYRKLRADSRRFLSISGVVPERF